MQRRKVRRSGLLVVVFDWGGTLAETAPFNHASHLEATHRFNASVGEDLLAAPTFSQIQQASGGGDAVRFPRAHPAIISRPELADLYMSIWVEVDRERRWRGETPPLAPGVSALLRRLKARGVTMGVMSDVPTKSALRTHLRRQRIAHYFQALWTRDARHPTRPKTDPSNLLWLLKSLSRSKVAGHSGADLGVFYVGDGDTDARLALAFNSQFRRKTSVFLRFIRVSREAATAERGASAPWIRSLLQAIEHA